MIGPIVGRVAGLDVHRKSIVVTLLLEESNGQIRKETREYLTFPGSLQGMAEWFEREQVVLAVMESTGIYWKSVHEVLEETVGLEIYVVNAYHVKKVPGRKTDVCDSEWLAELGRCGLVRPSFIAPKDLRDLQTLTRYRQKLVATLASEKNRLHKLLDTCGIRLGAVVSDIRGKAARRMVKEIIEGEKTPQEIAKVSRGRLHAPEEVLVAALEGHVRDRHRFVLRAIERHIGWLDEELAEIDGQIVAAMEPYQEEWRLLQTIPGVDCLGAAMLIAEIAVDMKRFGNRKRLCSWAGMCPGNNESAGKRRSGRTPKGNRHVRRLLCEMGNAVRNTKSQFRGLYAGLVIRRGHKRAVVAVGHKLLEVIYSVLVNRRPYVDPTVDYEAAMVHRNAPRWLRMLKEYGYSVPKAASPAEATP
jgi:transposase